MTTHHAVLFCATKPLVCELDEAISILPENEYRLAQFGIDDVRRLTEHAYRRPSGENAEQTLLVATEFITEEAQQALLKIIEEPPLSTKFVFIIPNGYNFLPTLESRFQRVGALGEEESNEAFKEFKKATVKDRFEMIEQAIKTKDSTWQTGIKRGLVGYLKEAPRKDMTTDTLKDLEFIARLLLTRGASNKFLLEHLALTLAA